MIHPKSSGLFEKVEDGLPLPEPVDEYRQGAHIQAVGSQSNQVRRNPIELGHQYPNCCRPWRHFYVEKSLHGKRKSEFLVKGGQVVHPSDVGGALAKGELLRSLFHSRVEIPDDRLGATNDLAFELDLKSEHAVGGWVLRAHVYDHPLVVGRIVVEQIIVVDDPAELGVESVRRLVGGNLLSTFVSRLNLRLLGTGNPHIHDLGWLLLGLVCHLSPPDGSL